MSSGPLDPAASDLFDGEPHPVRAGPRCPGVQRPAMELVQFAFVGYLVRSSLDEDTPSGVKEGAAIVHFEDDGSAAGDRAQFRSRLGAEHDRVIVREVVDREYQRLSVDHEADSADIGMELQEVDGLGSGELVHASLNLGFHAFSSANRWLIKTLDARHAPNPEPWVTHLRSFRPLAEVGSGAES